MEITLDKAKLEKKTLIFYHGGCSDGFSAAWVAHKKFGDDAEYIAADFHQVPDVKGKDIYMLDISVSDEEEDIKKLAKDNRIVFIDHHITRKNLVSLIPESYFSNDRSGAMLAWEYFFPDKESPVLIAYVQDQDLYTWKLPFAREIMVNVNLSERTFESWDKMSADLEDEISRNVYVEKGKTIQDYYNKICSLMIEEGAVLVEFEGFKVYTINVPHMFGSDIGNELALRTNSFGIVWSENGENISASLRSVRDFDVSEIAKKYGGGGHKNAAGFKLPIDAEKPWKKVNNNEK